jgi:hypothetical protein
LKSLLLLSDANVWFDMRLLILLGALFFTIVRLHASLKVTTNFESGSAKILSLEEATQTIRITPAGNVDRGMPNWWFFRVDGLDSGKPLMLELAARKVSLPADGEEGKASPLNAAWTFPARAAISMDGTNWSQTSPGKREGDSCVYRIPVHSSTVWLAWGPPFTPKNAADFTREMARTHPFVKAFTLAKSLEGRDVPGLEISEGDKPARQRPVIFITGRQHAWEVGGSWVAVSLAEWVTGDSEQAEWLRRNADVFIVPLMDVDHVATGDGGKHARPQDHNRDWSDAPHWPEVAATQKRLLQFAKENRLALFLDVHNPAWSAKLQKFYVQHPPEVSASVEQLTEQFLGIARTEFGKIDLTDEKPSSPEEAPLWKRISVPWVSDHGNTNTLAFTFETPWNIPQGTPEGYRETGRKLGLVVTQYFQQQAK